jgi:hypothetical protein
VEAWKKTLADLSSRERLWIWGVSSVVVSLSGPFGTFADMPTLSRVGYWTTAIGIAIALGLFVRHFLASRQAGWAVWQVEVVNVAVFTVLYGPGLTVATRAVFDLPADTLRTTPMLLSVALVAMAVAMGRLLAISMWAESDSGSRPRLAARLPKGDADILRLSVTDHYVEVFLVDGRVHRLLMRFCDAVTEMDGVPGHCTHRSHWVAAASVAGHLRSGGRDALILIDGSSVPVSRKYRPGLVDAGLIPATGAGAAVDQASDDPENGTASALRPVRTATDRAPNKAASVAVSAESPPV